MAGTPETPPETPRRPPPPRSRAADHATGRENPSLTSATVPAAVPPAPTDAPVLPATVAWAAARFGDRPALVDPDGSPLSYAELHRRSDEVAAGLARRG